MLSSFVKPKALPEIECWLSTTVLPTGRWRLRRNMYKNTRIFSGSSIKRNEDTVRPLTGNPGAPRNVFKVVDGDDCVDGAAACPAGAFLLHTTKSDFVVKPGTIGFTIRPEKKLEFESPFPGVNYGREYAFSEVSGKTFLKMHALTIKRNYCGKFPRSMSIAFMWTWNMSCFRFLCADGDVSGEIVYQYRIGLADRAWI